MLKGKDFLFMILMIAASVLLDIAVLLLVCFSSLFSLNQAVFFNISAVLVFTVLSLLILNAQLILMPLLKSRINVATVHRLTAVTCIYFIMQLLLTVLSWVFSPIFYLALSLALLAFFVLAAGLVLYVSDIAKTWGKQENRT